MHILQGASRVFCGALVAAALAAGVSALSTGDNVAPPRHRGSARAPSGDEAAALAEAQKRTVGAANSARSAHRVLRAPVPADLGSFTVSVDDPGLAVPVAGRPYVKSTVAPMGTGTRDALGVPMYRIGAKLYNHPVRQAQDGILALESYRISKQTKYLDQARLDAKRLLDQRVERGGGYFFPYPFNFALHGAVADMIHAPWYSGMAQGQALSLFSRLADATGDAVWRSAADGAFNSLLLPPVPARPSLPFVSWVDSERHLWIDEYAQLPLSKTDRTFNGHIFATFGVWDYYRTSHDKRAAQLFRGALSNVRFHTNLDWRTKSWISSYCVTHRTFDAKYHRIHTGQLALLHSITGRSDWAVWSDQFRDDYPPPAKLTGSVQFAAGRQIGYTFDPAGRALTSHAISLGHTWSAPTSKRVRIKGRGYYYLIAGGPLAGHWVLERPSAYRPGLLLLTTYSHDRLATFAAGKHTGWSMTSSGLRAGSRTITASHPFVASFDRSGWIDGASFVRIINGSLAGRWVPTLGLTRH